MNRKTHMILLLCAALASLFLGAGLRLHTMEDTAVVSHYDYELEDPYREAIFEDREFSNLIVSIHAEDEHLYNEETGLLTAQNIPPGSEGERPIDIFVYSSDKDTLIAQHAGIRISGATSRNAVRRSFRVIAREKYDKKFSAFTYDLWGGRQVLDGSQKEIQRYSSFILHAVRYSMDRTGINNSVGYSLARKAGIEDASPTVPAALYINGVYTGTYFIMPAKTDCALAELYRIPDSDDIEFVSVFEEEKIGVQTHPEVLEKYLDFVSFVQNADMNDPEVISSIEQQLDVEQCLRYYAVNLLLANGDWMDNNLRVWRCKDRGLPYQDGRWRFFLFDLDWIGSFPELTRANFEQAVGSNEFHNLLPSLLKNPDYMELFKDIIAQMEEDAFNEKTIREVFDLEKSRIRDEIAYDFQSEAFPGYFLYSVNSSPMTEDQYLTMDDWEEMVYDLEQHLLKAPKIINECLDDFWRSDMLP